MTNYYNAKLRIYMAKIFNIYNSLLNETLCEDFNIWELMQSKEELIINISKVIDEIKEEILLTIKKAPIK